MIPAREKTEILHVYVILSSPAYFSGGNRKKLVDCCGGIRDSLYSAAMLKIDFHGLANQLSKASNLTESFRLTFQRNDPQDRLVDWAVPDVLAMGSLPQTRDISRLKRAGIQTILSLCAEAEGTLPDAVKSEFRCLRYILPDSRYRLPLKVQQLQAVVNLIQQCERRRQAVYVHCVAGVERSPAACIAYLCHDREMELMDAIDWVKLVHPTASPSNHQLKVIRELTRQP